jgi:hypothetical protein
MSLADDKTFVAYSILAAFALILIGIGVILWWLPRGSAFSDYEKEFTAYESGKHRRYGLLFAVNGGAFTLAKLSHEHAQEGWLGRLSLDDLALGMIAFTLIMVYDIVTFGIGMRDLARKPHWSLWTGIFSLIGLLVLFVLCLLICAGWYFGQGTLPPGGIFFVVVLLAASTVAYIFWDVGARKIEGATRPSSGSAPGANHSENPAQKVQQQPSSARSSD